MLKQTLLAASLLLSASSHAALSQADWTTEGDSKALIDTRTGFEWLDLTVTDGMSISSVLSETTSGGLFEGWRLPTITEVLGLLQTAFNREFSTNQILDVPTAYGVLDNEFSRAIGVNHTTGKTSSYTNYALGMVMDPSGVVRYAGTSNVRYGMMKIYAGISVASGSADTVAPEYGVFLVSDGGQTITSMRDPNLLINNPNAPINQVPTEPGVEPPQVPADVPAVGLFALPFFALLFRRKSTSA